MKKILYMFGVLISASCLISAEKISIDDCYKLARENYPAIKQFDLINKTRDYNLDNANSKYYPQFGASASVAYLSESPMGMIPQDMYRGQITLNQVLWDGGNIGASKRITRAQAAIELENNEVALYHLNSRVNQMYFGVLLQNELLKQNLIHQDDINQAIGRINAMIKNGVANEYDLSLLEVELLNAKQAQVSIESFRSSYIEMLSVFIGKKIEDSDCLEFPKEVGELNDNIRRPELSYYDSYAALHDAKKEAVGADLMPKFSLFGAGGYGKPNFDTLARDFDFYGLIGAQVSISFGSYYTEMNEKLKILNERKSVEVARETFLFNTRIELVRQKEDIKRMERMIFSDIKIIGLRESIKKSAFAKMSNGVMTSRDYIKEMNALDSAKQEFLYHKIQKLSFEYNFKFIANN